MPDDAINPQRRIAADAKTLIFTSAFGRTADMPKLLLVSSRALITRLGCSVCIAAPEAMLILGRGAIRSRDQLFIASLLTLRGGEN